jgi:WhiB family redox-sensing transcriptional regulator
MGDVEVRMSWNEDWAGSALCQKSSPDELFVRGAEQHKAKVVCQACPVRTECLAEALDNRIEWGVWGGLTERERRAVLRKRPQVTSWATLLRTARESHERTAATA